MARRRRSADESGSWRAAPEDAVEDAVEQLVTRARKARRRGEDRRALVLLRDACNRDEWRPRTWTLFGAELSRAGRIDEAARAFQHARWLRARAGDQPRARVMDRLIAALSNAA